MTETFDGRVSINLSGTNNATVVLDAQTGDLQLGDHGQDVNVRLLDAEGIKRIEFNPGGNNIRLFDAVGNVYIGAANLRTLWQGGGQHADEGQRQISYTGET